MDLTAKIDGQEFLYSETEKIVADTAYREEIKSQLAAETPAEDSPLAAILKAMVKTPSQEEPVRAMLAGALTEIAAMTIEGPVGNVGEFLTGQAAAIDAQISLAVNTILHHPDFQALEAVWRGLAYLVFGTETGEMLKLRLLNASLKDLTFDLEKAVEFDQSRLFKNVYEEEYGTFGGEPYSCLVHIHEYGRAPADISLLKKLSEVAAAAHTPVLTAAAPQIFDLNSFTELSNPRDLAKIFQTTECIPWRSLRETEDARYLNFFLPRMLMRLPYAAGAVETFTFEEDVDGADHSKYLWGNAALAMARCVTAAFARHNWTAAIRGFEGGGLVEELPVHVFTRPSGDKAAKIPTEIAITDRREKELSDLGFIALIYRRGTDKAAFFGGQSLHKPPLFNTDAANANARISARLPYLLNASRFAHYLKSIIRDKVGSFTSAQAMADYLNNWISGYVLLTDDAGQSVKAKFPLREARVDVYDVPGAPGAYKAVVYLRPHFQLEELTASIRLVATLPPPVPPVD
ncbi:MAG: type VI secretion system contractile sheath large subunit [Candidatus Adiutrix sp.]|nr:type VI secretion system contractile sheath large subunit [Candidatus Adiutrix sp.]